MINDYKNCWFYQLCKKECKSDVAMIFAGLGIVLLMLFLFQWIISLWQILFIVIGVFLIGNGFLAFFKKLPKVKAFLRDMPPEWFASLGTAQPQSAFDTFYPTQYYLCIPKEYIMIRYCDIQSVTMTNIMSSGTQTGITLTFRLAVQPAEVAVAVSKWQEFQTEGNGFLKFIEDKKEEMLAIASGGNGVQ